MTSLSDEGSVDKVMAEDGLVKVPISHLEVGMFVAELDRPWLDTPFVVQGFTVKDQSEIEKLAEHCVHVYVKRWEASRVRDASHSDDLGAPAPSKIRALLKKRMRKFALRNTTDAEPQVSAASPMSVREAHPNARETYREALTFVRSLHHCAKAGQALDIEKAKKVVSGCVNSMIRNADAMIWMTRVKHPRDYIAEHSLNVCILAIAFGYHLELKTGKLNVLGLCGLLSDIGIVTVPSEILNKQGALTKEEVDVVQKHTIEGARLLSEVEGLPAVVKEVALTHHERPDGQGYPEGLGVKAAGRLADFSKMVAVVETYDALTSERSHASAKSSVEAQKILYEARGRQFDTDSSLQFMRVIGPYPPGTWVELGNGMVGVVLAAELKFRHLPRVIVTLGSDKKPVKYKTVDLFHTDSGGLDEGYLIKRPLKDGSYGMYLEGIQLG